MDADVRDIHKGSTHDAFSTSLHNLLVACPKLQTINLDGPICIDESFFWPQDPGSDEPRWSDLEHLWARLSAARPDGGWWLDSHPGMPLDEPIFVNDRESNSPDNGDLDNQSYSSGFSDDSPAPDKHDAHLEGLQTGDAFHLAFRSQPIESLERLLEAAARAARNMPSLCDMSVSMRVADFPRTDGRQEFEMRYEAKGNPRGRAKLL